MSLDNLNNPNNLPVPQNQNTPAAPGYGFDGSLESAGRLVGAGALVALGGALAGAAIGGLMNYFGRDEEKEKQAKADVERARSLQQEQLDLLREERAERVAAANAKRSAAERERTRSEIKAEIQAESAHAKLQKRLARIREERLAKEKEAKRAARPAPRPAARPDPMERVTPEDMKAFMDEVRAFKREMSRMGDEVDAAAAAVAKPSKGLKGPGANAS